VETLNAERVKELLNGVSEELSSVETGRTLRATHI